MRHFSNTVWLQLAGHKKTLGLELTNSNVTMRILKAKLFACV